MPPTRICRHACAPICRRMRRTFSAKPSITPGQVMASVSPRGARRSRIASPGQRSNAVIKRLGLIGWKLAAGESPRLRSGGSIRAAPGCAQKVGVLVIVELRLAAPGSLLRDGDAPRQLDVSGGDDEPLWRLFDHDNAVERMLFRLCLLLVARQPDQLILMRRNQWTRERKDSCGIAVIDAVASLADLLMRAEGARAPAPAPVAIDRAALRTNGGFAQLRRRFVAILLRILLRTPPAAATHPKRRLACGIRLHHSLALGHGLLHSMRLGVLGPAASPMP